MVGQLKQARPVHRSGEPALGGAEQKPLQQVAGQGRAVLRNKGLPAPWMLWANSSFPVPVSP